MSDPPRIRPRSGTGAAVLVGLVSALVAGVVRILHGRALAASDPLSPAMDASGPLGPHLVEWLGRLPDPVGAFGGALGLDAVACGAAALVATRLLGPWVGALTGLLLAAYAPLLALAVPGSPAPPVLLLSAVLLGLLTPRASPDATGRTRVRVVRFAVAGLVALLLVGFQPGWLIGLPLVLLSPWVRGDPARWLRTSALAGGMALGVAVLVFAAPADPAAPLTDPVPGALTAQTAERGEAGRSLAEGVRGWRDTGEAVRDMPMRISYLVNHIEISSHRRIEYQEAHSPWVDWGVGFGLLLPLAFVGLARMPEPEIRPLHLLLAAGLLPVLVLPVGALLRIPLLVPLGIFAATGVVTAYTIVRQNRGEAFVAALLLFGAGWVFSHLPVEEVRPTLDWVEAAEALLARGEPLEAEEMLDRARFIDPRLPELYEAYVGVYRATGRPQAAEGAAVQARVMREIREAEEAREGGR